MWRILQELGHSIATPAEARDILALKGGDNVGFQPTKRKEGSSVGWVSKRPSIGLPRPLSRSNTGRLGCPLSAARSRFLDAPIQLGRMRHFVCDAGFARR